MADNYLERRLAEINEGQKKIIKKGWPSLDTLLHRNRSVRGFDPSVKVSEAQLKEIVAVNTLVPSAMNRQGLRFKLLTGVSAQMVPLLRIGGALPEEGLPKPGMEPDAFIVACAAVPEGPDLFIDLGIALQSMGLKAAEMGLDSLIVRAFDPLKLADAFSLPLKPLAVMAVGKGAERIFLMPVHAGESLQYYRKDGVHFVPKLCLEDLLL